MAEEVNASSVGNNKASSDGRGGENKYGSSKGARIRAGVSFRQDPYTMEVDRKRNCYACGGFGHMVHHYRNRGRERAIEGRRIEYGRGRIKEIYEHLNNLKGVESLELLD